MLLPLFSHLRRYVQAVLAEDVGYKRSARAGD